MGYRREEQDGRQSVSEASKSQNITCMLSFYYEVYIKKELCTDTVCTNPWFSYLFLRPTSSYCTWTLSKLNFVFQVLNQVFSGQPWLRMFQRRLLR